MTAKEFWKDKFNEYPQSDQDKLAIAMMAEYADQESRIRAREAAKKAFAAGMKNGILYMENPEQTIYVDEYLSSNGLAENENNPNEIYVS